MGDKEQIMEESKSLASANNQLALRMLRKLSQDGENVFFSPFSISIAMAMLLRGAKEETLTEMMKVLGHEDANLSPDEVHKKFGDLFLFLSQNKQQYTLDVANAIVSHKDFQLLPDYVQDLEQFYQALASQADFINDSEKALNQINGWVNEKTRGMISKILSFLDPSTVAVLLNAVYFKGSWMETFDPKSTQPQKFYNKGKEDLSKDIPMMFQSEKFLYADKGDYKALELPYEGNDIAMLILLPKDIAGVDELEKQLGVDFINTLKPDMFKIKVDVTLPKFRMEYSKELIPVFQELGLTTVFDHQSANLKGLSDSDELEVSAIIHKAVLVVNEEGSEAAAVTAIMVAMCAFIPPTEFVVDHPFLFVIYNKPNNMILFMGRVNDL